jgi:hypothetical protein
MGFLWLQHNSELNTDLPKAPDTQENFYHSFAGSALNRVLEQTRADLSIIASKGEDHQKWPHYFSPVSGISIVGGMVVFSLVCSLV